MNFDKHSFANLSDKDVFKESLELSIAPAIICLLLGVITLLTADYGDKVIYQAVIEFLQIVGLKITLYGSITASGLCLLFARVSLIKKLLGWLTASIAKFGFTLSAVISGVYLGLSIPAGIESGNFKLVLGMLLISSYFALLQFMFISIAKMANYEFNEINLNKSKYFDKFNVHRIVPWVGIIFIIIGISCFNFELWPTVFE